MKESIK